jgi:hypothetical protein
MKRFFLLLILTLVHLIQAQDVQRIEYSDPLLTNWITNATGTRMLIFTIDDPSCLGAGCHYELLLADMNSGEILISIDATGINDIRFSEDGERFAVSWIEGEFGSDSDDYEMLVEIRASEDGSVLDSMDLPDADFEGESDEIVKPFLRFSPDLRIMVRTTVPTLDGRVYGPIREMSVWDIEEDELLYEEFCEDVIFWTYAIPHILSPNGDYLLAGCADARANVNDIIGEMKIIELATGEIIQEIPRYSEDPVLYWSENSEFLVLRENGMVRFFNLEGQIVR